MYCPSCGMRKNEHDGECCFPGCHLNPDNDTDFDNHRLLHNPDEWYDSHLWLHERGSEEYEEIKDSLTS